MSQAEVVQIIVTGIAGILVPIALLVVGNWYIKQKDRAEAYQRTADRAALLLSHLASDKNQ